MAPYNFRLDARVHGSGNILKFIAILFFKDPILTDAVDNAQEQMNDKEGPETTSTTDLIKQDVNGLGFKLH